MTTLDLLEYCESEHGPFFYPDGGFKDILSIPDVYMNPVLTSVMFIVLGVYIAVFLSIGSSKEMCYDVGQWNLSDISYVKVPRKRRNLPAVNGELADAYLSLLERMQHKSKKSYSSSQEYDIEELHDQVLEMNKMFPKKAFFLSLAPKHNAAVVSLQRMFAQQPSSTMFLQLARHVLDHNLVNPKVWYFALQNAAMDRTDMQGVVIPHPVDFVPDYFIPGSVLKTRKSKKRRRKKKKKDTCFVLDGSTGEKNGMENLLWYFREDLMLNQHHFYWHQMYPLNTTTGRHGDRRGELFYYSHRTLVARYNAERLSLGLSPVSEQEFYPGAVIKEGYDSQLIDSISGKPWTPRPSYTKLKDVIHIHDSDFERNISIGYWKTLLDRLNVGIRSGKLSKARWGTFPIRNPTGGGINALADTLEATELSVDPFYYDIFGLHNLGHHLIGLSADPEFLHRLPSGIMVDPTVSVRDPAFYTYHKLIDNIFEHFKATLPPYKLKGGSFPLQWDGIIVREIKTITRKYVVNRLRTFFTKRKLDVKSALLGKQSTCVKASHLNHDPFAFEITVDRLPCAKTSSGVGTVRIFMAPRFDENGNRFTLNEQRRLFFPLDAFTVQLSIGRNFITRRDVDSPLATPWSKTITELKDSIRDSQPNSCGCGWPQHLYVPRGSPEGTKFDLFVMITNADHDIVPDKAEEEEFNVGCDPAYILCGIPGRLYPDRKPMGYPFDRRLFLENCPTMNFLCKDAQPRWIEDFAHSAPNMDVTTVKIVHRSK